VKKAVPITKAVALVSKRAELSRARAVARAWSETIADARRTSQAALFTRAAMQAFAADVAPGLTLSDPFVVVRGKLDATSRQLAQSIGQEAAALPLLEGCHFLTSLYTTLLPGKERSALGAFYTPPALTRRLLDLAGEGGVDWSSARVLDPASGGGAFLLEAAARMRQALNGSEPAFILAQLLQACGWAVAGSP
jgi:adenine-specific DNA-methyltransferase